MTLTPTEQRTLADLAEKFAALAIDLAKVRRGQFRYAPDPGYLGHYSLYFARLLTEAVDDEITGDSWIALREHTLAIVKAAERTG